MKHSVLQKWLEIREEPQAVKRSLQFVVLEMLLSMDEPKFIVEI